MQAHEGAGLGLALAKSLMERHRLASKPPEAGTEPQFEVKVDMVPPPGEKISIAAHIPKGNLVKGGMKLVVDWTTAEAPKDAIVRIELVLQDRRIPIVTEGKTEGRIEWEIPKEDHKGCYFEAMIIRDGQTGDRGRSKTFSIDSTPPEFGGVEIEELAPVPGGVDLEEIPD